MLLRGVNWSGLEYSPTPIPADHIERITGDWNANIIRVPFNQQWALEDESYRVLLDQAAECGVHVLLDLQWINAEIPYGADNFVPPLPNSESIEVWRLLARRYRDNPAVLFDLFNEPHHPLPDDPYPLVSPDGALLSQVTMAEWQPWALALIDAIRDVHPQSLIFVSGVDWGYDLRGFPLARPNLVYSTHVYPQRGDEWDSAFGELSRRVPVFAAEWGGTDLTWGRRTADYLDAFDLGWTAWSWCDEPRLQNNGTPTPFGALVRDRLRALPERRRP